MLGLSACFTAEKPLLTDDNSVAPFASIGFVEHGSADTPALMIRDGKAYIDQAKDQHRILRFMPVKENWYVAEMSGADEDATVQRLYALVHVDLEQKTAETYASMGDDKDVGPGLRACEAGICIDDLAAYVARAQAIVDAGAKPDTIFDITVE
jgi:hypothetical protein